MASFKGHIQGGLVASLGTIILVLKGESLLQFAQLPIILMAMISTLLGSLLPDIDHPQSLIGRRIRIVSQPIYKYVGHRTLTHSFIVVACLGGIVNTIGGKRGEILAIGIAIGMSSHIILDFFSKGGGVAFFYPLYPKKIYGVKLYKRKRKRRKRH